MLLFRAILILLCMSSYAFADIDVLVRLTDGPGGRRIGDIIAAQDVPNKGWGKSQIPPFYASVRVVGVTKKKFDAWNKRHHRFFVEERGVAESKILTISEYFTQTEQGIKQGFAYYFSLNENVKQGSLVIRKDLVTYIENEDYSVDYESGSVKVIPGSKLEPNGPDTLLDEYEISYQYLIYNNVRSHYRLDKTLLTIADQTALVSNTLVKPSLEITTKLVDRTTQKEINDSLSISEWLELKGRLRYWASLILPGTRAAATTTVTKIVDPDNGAGTDYLNLDAWEDAFGGTAGGGTPGNLPAGDEIAVAQCRNSSGSGDTATFAILGWTTGPANYILVEAYSGYAHAGVYDESKFWMYNSDLSTKWQIRENYVIFDHIQFKQEADSGSRYGLYINDIDAGGSLVLIKNCISKGVLSGTAVGYGFFAASDADLNVVFENCISYDYNLTFNRGFQEGGNATSSAYHCTAYNNTTGFRFLDTMVNCISFNNTDDFYGGTMINYCASDDGDGTNAIAPSGADWANEMPNYATYNFAITNTGNCYQAGLNDPSGSGYGDPAINSVARPTAPILWSVGAFEPAGASTPAASSAIIMNF